jgi:hypothetical protein
MDEKRLEKLNKIATSIRNNAISKNEIKEFLTFVLEVITKSKENFENLSKENLQKISETLAYIEQNQVNVLDDLDTKSNATLSQIDTKLALVNNLIKKVKKIKATKGKDGYTPIKDVDYFDGEKGEPGKDGSPDEAEDIKEKLESLKDENRLDASAIKNLPEFINNKANGGGWRNLYQMHDVSIDSPTNGEVLKYNSTTNVWENGTASGGASAFTDLTDTPANYTGSSLKAVRVNVGETGLEFYTPSSGTGTVTSVDMSVPTGLAISGNPVTTSGTLALALDTGYVIPQQTTLDGFVPYSGATGDVDLGLFDLQATDLSAGGTLSVGNVISDLTPLTDGAVSLGSAALRYSTVATNSVAFDSNISIGADTVADDVSVETLTFSILNNVSNLKAILDTSSIATTDKTFTFPNASGTIALTSDIPTGSGITRTQVSTSGSITLGSVSDTDYVYYVTGNHTLTMPAPNNNRYTIKNNYSANITIDTIGAELIEGASSISIAPEESVDIISNTTDWFVV